MLRGNNGGHHSIDFVLLSALLPALAVAACSAEETPSVTADTEAAATGGEAPSLRVSLRGIVSDAQGNPLGDVTVQASDGTEVTTTEDGRFSVEADHGESVVLIFRKGGYVRGLERIDLGMSGDATTIEVTMVPMALPIPFDSTQGGTVVGMRGAEMTAPADSFRTRDGEPVTGMVQVQLTPLNPSIPAELDAYPGDNLARDAQGTTIQLETFGVVDVTVTQGDEDLDIREGMGVDVKFPLPDPLPNDPPETIALWGFDDDAGVWVEEGVATLNLDEGAYEGTITHLSPWNCDQPLTATCIKGRVIDDSGEPVAGAFVLASGIDYSGSGSAVADEDGVFAIPVRKDSRVTVETFHPGGGTVEREVLSGSADTEVPADRNDSRCLDVGDWVMTDPGTGEGWDDSCEWGDQSRLAMTVSGHIDDSFDWAGDPWIGVCGGVAGSGSDDSFVMFYPGDEGGTFPLDVVLFVEAELSQTGSVPATLYFAEDFIGFGQMWLTLDGECSANVTRNDLIAPGIVELAGEITCSGPATPYPTGLEDIRLEGPAEFSGVVLYGDAGSETLVQCCYGGAGFGTTG